jgi:hypothetical protein
VQLQLAYGLATQIKQLGTTGCYCVCNMGLARTLHILYGANKLLLLSLMLETWFVLRLHRS